MHLVLLAALGCNSVSGKIDENSVSINTSAMMEYEVDGGDDYIVVALASHGLDCEEWADFYDDFNDKLFDDLDLEDAEDLWEETLPEDFWQVVIRLRADDVDDRADKVDWDPEDWDDGLSDDGDASIFASHTTEWWDKDEPLADISDDYRGDRGSLKIGSHKPSGKISGTYKTMMVDGDGDDEGQVTVRFSADHCSSLEDWF
jgi:hypothetical protein